jgi:hypothetical protein
MLRHLRIEKKTLFPKGKFTTLTQTKWCKVIEPTMTANTTIYKCVCCERNKFQCLKILTHFMRYQDYVKRVRENPTFSLSLFSHKKIERERESQGVKFMARTTQTHKFFLSAYVIDLRGTG